MRKIVISILFSVLTAIDVSGQNFLRDETVRRGKDFSFHIFSGSGNSHAVANINQLLQLSELYFLPNRPYNGSIFNQSQANDGSIYGGKTSIKQHVYSNTTRILSMGFFESASGATSHYWVKYYNFNPRTGDRISLRDLFTSAGYESFLREVVALRSCKFRREVNKKIEPQFREEYLQSTLKFCIEVDDLNDFYIRSGTIVFDGDSCLTKGQKFDGLDMIVRLNAGRFSREMNAYGKAVFGLSTVDLSQFRSTQLPQLFEGTVGGKYPFVMVLSPDGSGNYSGMYAYLKHREGVALKGEQKNGDLTLTEYILSKKTVVGPLGSIRRVEKKGTVTGRLTEGRFDGTWSDAAGQKTFSFNASFRK